MDGPSSRLSAAAAVAAGHPVLVHSFDQWRVAARDLLAHQVAPHQVQWISSKHDGEFASPPACTREDDCEPNGTLPIQADTATLRISRELMDMLQAAACCRVPNRWAFLYLVVWRWQHGDKEVLAAADQDGSRLRAMVKAVRRDEQEMHACIRFRERREDAGPPRFVAWCEPAHDVLPQVARHFTLGMGRVTWMIATPDASVMWDGAALHTTGPLMRGPEGLGDAGEAQWLRYCRGIYHPARLNVELVHSQGAAAPRVADKHLPQREAPGTLDQCRRCELWQHATQAVPGEGPATARIMLVGEQPGDQEDLLGHPFVGPAGKLLDRAMSEAELERRKVYLTNAVKHFKWEPRGKRRMHKTPAQREVEACSYWLDSELARVKPKVIVAMGSTALKAVLKDPRATLKAMIGQPFQHEGRWIVVIYHPSFVLRVPGEDAKAQAYALMVAGLREARRLAG